MKSKILQWVLVVLVYACLISCSSIPTPTRQPVTIFYEKDASAGIVGEAQVELISPGGIRVLIDVAKPYALSKPVTPQDILLTTHLHYDHFNRDFADAFPGKQLRMEKGEISLLDVSIKSIVASHSSILPSEPGGGNNFIFVVDIGGMRIVHFGDTEQLNLTADQLVELGNVDVAFMEFWIDSSNKYFKMMDQAKPRLIIPTHLGGLEAAKYATQKWPSSQRMKKWLKLTLDDLPSDTTFLLLGEWAKEFGEGLNLPEWLTK